MNQSRSVYKRVKWLFGKEIEIPEEWEVKKLESIGDIIGGGTPDSTNTKYWNGNILWAIPTDITKLSTSYINDTERKITKNGLENSSAKLLPVGTILITSRATIGKCAIAIKPMATNQGFQSIICNDNFDRLFIFYMIKHDSNKLLRLSYGTTFLEISKAAIKSIAILVPKKDEQTKIASILSGVDAAIEATQRGIEKAGILKKGLMQKLLTKGIGHTEFKKVKWRFGKEIEIPEEWEIKKITDVTKISVGLVINPSSYFDDNGIIPMITGKNVTEKGIVLDNVDFISEKNNKLLEKTRIWSGDLVTMRVGYPGRTSLIKNENNGINCASLIITRKSKKYISQFLCYLANSELISKQIIMYQAGSAQEVVNVSSWGKFLVPLPPLFEQTKIASILSGIDAYVQKSQEYKKKMELLKKGLMQKLLTGQIRVKVDH